MKKEITSTIGLLGSSVAVALSYVHNASVGWAILHFFCGWAYVAYWITRHLLHSGGF